ncbi:phenylalanine--tRNA ligase subunit beta [Flavobacteriaceae bacterium]|nr:phenylalanine--tRNA ligase subunit beta [Flavobacteriaceae bacterium]
MKISYNWLKQYVNTDWDSEKTSNLLTDLGLEVEGTEVFQSVKGGLEGIVVGQVLECTQHPNADRLKLASVDIGADEPLKIVCGAPNVAKNQKVAVATIGTTLYTHEGEAWNIKKGKIRGEESHGMLCAEDELGLGTSHDGILVLDENAEIGSPLATYFEVENDIIFEIGLTPNRADAMSHFGTARDLRAGLIQNGINPELMSPSVSGFHVHSRTLKINIEVEDKIKAPRYCGVTISGVNIQDSPTWLQNRLKAIGLAPINNVVDITNFVLHGLGQPLHAFDADKITDKKLIVRTAQKNEKFVTLDGVERTLNEEDLMICDAKKPMCIAGVFGGLNSGISEQTTNVFLESAYFDPVSIRKTAKRHGLSTDASFRFERGVDPNITKYALKYAAILITEIAGGEISSDLWDEYPVKIEDQQVLLNFQNITNIIGQEIPRETIKQILTSLEIKVNSVTETGLGLTIPAYRNDVQREIDMIEEILRVYGYNNIDITNKLNASIPSSSKKEEHKIESQIANHFVSLGFNEIMTNSLSSEKYTALSDQLNEKQYVKILNPLSSDLSVMRRTLLFSGLEAVAFNLNRQQTQLKLFEFGKTYHQFDDKREEFKHLSIFLTGSKTSENWSTPTTTVDFYYLKGIVSSVFEKIGLTTLKTKPIKSDIFDDGLALVIGKSAVVEFGIVKQNISKTFGIDQEVFYADFNWDLIFDSISSSKVKFKPISKFPEVRRDFALLIDEDIKFETIYQLAKQTDHKVLSDINLFDVYKGKNLPKGKKSYAVSFTLQDDSKTLTDKQIDKIMSKLQQKFEKEIGAELR